MNVLSLFDGISCGRIALDRAGIKVDKYYASEIDKYATHVSVINYPDSIRLGDINNWESWDINWSEIDLILAGSPCQGFSFAGKQLAFDDPRSALFFRFAEILETIKEANSNVLFLLENVKMKTQFENIISCTLGVKPVLINSASVSAQDRKRLYWCNWNIEQPKDKNICIGNIQHEYQINEPVDHKYLCSIGWLKWWEENKDYQLNKKYSWLCRRNDKAITMTARQYASWNGNFIQLSNGSIRKLTPIECERLQNLPDNYTACISDAQRYKSLGNCWTVNVISHILKQSQNHG